MRRISFAVFALIAMASPAIAQRPGDIKKGAALALSVCAQCHAVRVGQSRSPNKMAPSFASVAATPGMTATALGVWLQSSHPTMPNFIFTLDERHDVAAYILSLKAGSSAM